MKKEKKCNQCCEVFTKHPSRKKTWPDFQTRKFCSQECSRLFRVGKKRNLSEVWKKNITISNIKHKKGIPLKLEHRKRISFSMPGEKSPFWKGEKVSYSGLHHWVASRLGKPSECAHCGFGGLKGHKIHWANKSGQYKRNLEDWLRLCVSCHKEFDLNRQHAT